MHKKIMVFAETAFPLIFSMYLVAVTLTKEGIVTICNGAQRSSNHFPFWWQQHLQVNLPEGALGKIFGEKC